MSNHPLAVIRILMALGSFGLAGLSSRAAGGACRLTRAAARSNVAGQSHAPGHSRDQRADRLRRRQPAGRGLGRIPHQWPEHVDLGVRAVSRRLARHTAGAAVEHQQPDVGPERDDRHQPGVGTDGVLRPGLDHRLDAAAWIPARSRHGRHGAASGARRRPDLVLHPGQPGDRTQGAVAVRSAARHGPSSRTIRLFCSMPICRRPSSRCAWWTC